MSQIILVTSQSFDPAYNLALEETLVEGRREGNIYVYLWRNNDVVVVGRYQNVFEEIDVEYALSEKIGIVRRNTGGGAVFQDKGNINISFVGSSSDHSFVENSIESVLDMLGQYGLTAYQKGRNDIYVGDSKVSGWASSISQDTILLHGTMLVCADIERLERVLTRNNKISDSLAVSSRRSRVDNISSFLDEGIDADMFINGIENFFCRQNGVSQCGLTAEQKLTVSKKEARYRSKDWTYGYCPEFNFTTSRRFRSGAVRLNMIISDQIVQCVSISGDYFTKNDIGKIENALAGSKSLSDIQNVLSRYDTTGIIDGVTNDELIGMFSEIMKG